MITDEGSSELPTCQVKSKLLVGDFHKKLNRQTDDSGQMYQETIHPSWPHLKCFERKTKR